MGAPDRSRNPARAVRSPGVTTWSAAVTSTGSSPPPSRPRRAAFASPAPGPRGAGPPAPLPPGTAGELGGQQTGDVVGVDDDPVRPGHLEGLDRQVDQRPAGRG